MGGLHIEYLFADLLGADKTHVLLDRKDDIFADKMQLKYIPELSDGLPAFFQAIAGKALWSVSMD